MNLKKHFLLIFIFLTTLTFGQETQEKSEVYKMTLQDAIDFAMDSAYANINAQQDVAIAIKKKWETTADGLPQINGQVNYENNPKLTVTPLPGELIGEPGTTVPVSFGNKHNMNASARLDQLIFDGSYIVALQAAKTFLEYSANNKLKTEYEVRTNVITAYGNVLLSKNSIDITENNLDNAENNLDETQKIFDNGLAEEEEVEQLKITTQQLKSQLNNAKRMHEIAKESLNMVLGLPVEAEVILLDELEILATQNILETDASEDFKLEETVDFKIAKNLVEQRDLEFKLEKSKALPTLSAFVNYGATSFGDEFNFFESGKDWYEFSTIGVSLSVPIFSSFQRHSRTQQAKMELEKAEVQKEQAINEIKRTYNAAKSEMTYATENFEISKDNLNLAERISHKNEIKFKEGLASSFELRQAQVQLYQAQNEYLQSMLNVINAKAELEKIKNKPLQN
ncbi:TolC family protein [Psychroflexus halocasei]|uniref:Outer membrane protein TolC n=1 Tax=Psychroflexus halocasei TaxID=908615 RepID=A0A1H4D3U0_9FLAO|nr:TolC family protein [Psychroflexus halocasei]SEA67394.1 Outer membrane protein TolC [Psychroflexus halocasei]